MHDLDTNEARLASRAVQHGRMHAAQQSNLISKMEEARALVPLEPQISAASEKPNKQLIGKKLVSD